MLILNGEPTVPPSSLRQLTASMQRALTTEQRLGQASDLLLELKKVHCMQTKPKAS
jgi:hypothetical protein